MRMDHIMYRVKDGYTSEFVLAALKAGGAVEDRACDGLCRYNVWADTDKIENVHKCIVKSGLVEKAFRKITVELKV